jgi:hypothetical protein
MQVVYLNLHDNKLAGTLPAELSHLTGLHHLALGENKLVCYQSRACCRKYDAVVVGSRRK